MQIMQNASPTLSAPAAGREAKRERTLRRVEKAAVALALEYGTERVTVDQICEASDISARTFFNYFGSKDAAIVGTASKIPPQELLDAFVAADGPVLGDFLHCLVESVRRHNPDIDLIKARRELFEREPHLAMQRMTREANARDIYRTVIAERLRRENPQMTDPEVEDEALIAVAIALGILHAAGSRWIESGGTSEIDPLISQALERLRRLV
jgi:AcrR family transcriptional regulator